MKALVLKSNHGNHTGFNRTWDVLESFEDESLAQDFLNNYLIERDLVDEDGNPDPSYDGYRYVVITEDDYNRGIFDGGSYGYANKTIVSFFEDEKPITLILELNDGFEPTSFNFNSRSEALEAIKGGKIDSLENNTEQAQVYYKTEDSDGLLCDFEDLNDVTLEELREI